MEPRVPLSLMMQLAPSVCAGRLEVVGMKKPGKNAADFGLAFYAGRLLSEMPEETEFIILSEDGDLDHVVNLLRGLQRKVERINGNPHAAPVKAVVSSHPGSSVSGSGKDAASGMLTDPDVENYIMTRLMAGMTRPAKKATLMRSIQTVCKKRPDLQPAAVFSALVERGILVIGVGGKVRYLDGFMPEGCHECNEEDDDDEGIPF
ncbi:MAG: PIN domain-containing protein [Magnetococcus sp. YQC-5]